HLKGRIGDSPRLIPRRVVRSFSESRATAARLSKLGRDCASRSLPPVLLRVAPEAADGLQLYFRVRATLCHGFTPIPRRRSHPCPAWPPYSWSPWQQPPCLLRIRSSRIRVRCAPLNRG